MDKNLYEGEWIEGNRGNIAYATFIVSAVLVDGRGVVVEERMRWGSDKASKKALKDLERKGAALLVSVSHQDREAYVKRIPLDRILRSLVHVD